MDLVIKRSKRKSFSLTLNDRGEAVVRAPLYATDEQIFAFVNQHKRWLSRRLAERENVPKLSLKEGVQLCLFGRIYTVYDGKRGVKGDYIYLNPQRREEDFIFLLKQMAKEEMEMRTGAFAREYGFTYQGVRISSAQSRWGSCNQKGNIAYTFRCAFLPVPALDYLSVHELCHTKHLNHSTAFWQEVEHTLPDWKKRRAQLKSYNGFMRLL